MFQECKLVPKNINYQKILPIQALLNFYLPFSLPSHPETKFPQLPLPKQPSKTKKTKTKKQSRQMRDMNHFDCKYRSGTMHRYFWQIIDYQLMKIFLLSLLFCSLALCQLCTQPQRSFYMSFQTLSKRDTLQAVFEEMSTTMSIMQNHYTDSQLQASFSITNVKGHPFYNDHEQKDIYMDRYSANVSMGTLAVASFFNYSIKYDDQKKDKEGRFRIRGFVDPSYFTKTLIIKDGYLQWKPVEVPALTFSQSFGFEYASPNVTEEQMKIILKMVNNQAGNYRIKDQIQVEMNTKYGPLLSQMLNHQNLISNNNFTYKYGDISINFTNLAKDVQLSNDTTKGLQVFLIFGFQHATQNCTKLPKDFDEDQYGGLQELYTFSQVRAIIKQALYMGLYDKTIDKEWDVSGFQFRMGDLGNFVPYANNVDSTEHFGALCKFNRTRLSQLTISKYDEHSIYVGVPISCFVHYKGKDILQFDMDVNVQAYLQGQEQSISAIVKAAGIYGLSWQSIDPNYQVVSQPIAQYSITEVLNGLVGKTTFGTFFPIIRRKYPVVRVLEDRIIIYDPSEY